MNIAQERLTGIQKHQSEQLFCQLVLNINESTKIKRVLRFLSSAQKTKLTYPNKQKVKKSMTCSPLKDISSLQIILPEKSCVFIWVTVEPTLLKLKADVHLQIYYTSVITTFSLEYITSLPGTIKSWSFVIRK